MKIYEQSAYESIKAMYPVWYARFYEMDSIWRICGAELDRIRSGIEQVVDNSFVATADPTTIEQLEEFLYVAYDSKRSIEERRSMVASFFVGQGHIGQAQIKEIVRAFVSGDITVKLLGGSVHVAIRQTTDAEFVLKDCIAMLKKRLPAHLGLLVEYSPCVARVQNSNSFGLYDLGLEHTIRTYLDEPVYLDGQQTLDGTWHVGSVWKQRPHLEQFGYGFMVANRETITATITTEG